MAAWKGYEKTKVYHVSQLTEFFDEVGKGLPTVKSNRKYILNVPASFDIETSSFNIQTENGAWEKAATMYIWQFGLDGSVIYGRYWNEFLDFLDKLVEYYNLSQSRVLIVYVHNLGYEFQFIKKFFDWEKVFAIKNRRPVKAKVGPIEFRCSLFLSNYSLAYLGDNMLHKYPIKKLVGDLDYSLLRHSATPLTDKELQYCVNDVRVVMSYIQEKIENDGGIQNIPLTNTGYVRQYCRESCFYEGAKTEAEKKRIVMNYRAMMKSLTITSKDEYDQLHRAFMGGFTHASAIHSGKIMEDVGSADLTSSYPYVMVTSYFPMSKGQYIGSVTDSFLFKHFLENYCCLFDIELVNVKPLVDYENILSFSRCDATNAKVNNGRIISADVIRATMTELDYHNVTKFYTWTSMRVTNLRIYKRDYLPRPLILAILNMYKDKTSLKGVFGKEVEYLVSKNMINSAFGMMVTAIIRDEFYINDNSEWSKSKPTDETINAELQHYNKSFNRFLFYAWGVWVTAHARNNLFSAILEFKEDYIYADTDSIKGINFDSHKAYFENYNNKVLINLLKVCGHYNIPFSMCNPKTIKGQAKLLGVWEREEGYKYFKTVGAKRYIYMHSNGFVNMTVSGVNKKFAMPYLITKANNVEDEDELRIINEAYQGNKEAVSQLISSNYAYLPIFEEFGDGLFIPKGHTGKLTLTYIDKEQGGTITDYLGNTAFFHELSSIHMEPQSYYMSIVGDYLKFLEGVEYEEY